MKKISRRDFLKAAGLAAAAVGLTACGTGAASSAAASAPASAVSTAASAAASSSGKTPYIIEINPLINLAVFTNSDKGITDASSELGFKLKILGCTELADTAAYEMIQSAITEQPDAIVLCPWDYSAIAPLYQDAEDKGIAMIDISSDSGEDSGRVTFVGTDNTTYGQLAAGYINDLSGGKASVLTMMAHLDTSNQLEQRTAFEAKCASDYPDIKTILVDEDNGDSVTGLQKFEDDLKAHPEVDTIFCLESIGGVAAANAVEELGLSGINILAIDNNDDTVQYIRDGKIWGTMAQNFYKMGHQAGVAAMDYLAGKTVDKVYDSGTVLITKDNVDSYTFG